MKTFLKLSEVSSLRAVQECSEHPAKIWKINDKIMKPIIKGKNNGVPWHSCQFSSLPKFYIQNASLEISKVSNVFNNNSISGDKIIPFITKKNEGYDINSDKDWLYAEHLISNNKVKLPQIRKPIYFND